MNYIVNLNKGIDFAPSSEEAEILQNVRTIISTLKESVPLDRSIGVSWEHVDMPVPVARMMFKVAVIDAVNEREPRANIESIEYEDNEDDLMEGIGNPRVIVSIGEEEEEF